MQTVFPGFSSLNDFIIFSMQTVFPGKNSYPPEPNRLFLYPVSLSSIEHQASSISSLQKPNQILPTCRPSGFVL